MKLAHKFKSYRKWTEEPRSIHALLSLEIREKIRTSPFSTLLYYNHIFQKHTCAN